jgi:hypothetical protein
MFYVFLTIPVLAAVVVAGRAHSRRLDELERLQAMDLERDPIVYFVQREPNSAFRSHDEVPIAPNG